MRRGSLFGALLTTLVATMATPAAAQDTTSSWNCRASVLQIAGTAADPRFEPLVANGASSGEPARPQCADDNAGLPELVGDGYDVRTLGVATSVTPNPGAARDQTARAAARIAEAALASPNGELTISATAIKADAAASCVNGVPAFTGASTVADLAVNGQRLPIDDTVLNEITQQFNASPLGGIVRVLVNQRIQTADSLTVQAVRIELLSAAGTPQGTIVLGEAKVSAQGAACAPAPAPGGTDGTNGSNGANGANGSNGTNGTGAPAPVTTGSGATVNPVVINGSNGGCGRLKVWWEKVDLLHRLPGKPVKTTSRFGQRAMMRGQLKSCSGKPIVGAILDHIHVVGKGVGKLTKTGIKTRSAGKFTYIQPLNLTTRTIRIVYRGNLASNRPTAQKSLRLIVRGKKGQIIRGKPPRTLE